MIDKDSGRRYNGPRKAGVAQLVEYKLPKLGVAGSRPVARSIFYIKSVRVSHGFFVLISRLFTSARDFHGFIYLGAYPSYNMQVTVFTTIFIRNT